VSKTIVSPVKEFPGSIKLPDRLTMPQALILESSISSAQALTEEESSTQTAFDAVMLGAIFECIEEINLDRIDNLTVETFPATPRTPSAELIAWMYGELIGMYNPEVPNE
jgi:hypothetical protein